MGHGHDPALLALVLDMEAEADAYAALADAEPPNMLRTMSGACCATACIHLYGAAARLRKALGMEPRVPMLNLDTK